MLMYLHEIPDKCYLWRILSPPILDWVISEVKNIHCHQLRLTSYILYQHRTVEYTFISLPIPIQ